MSIKNSNYRPVPEPERENEDIPAVRALREAKLECARRGILFGLPNHHVRHFVKEKVSAVAQEEQDGSL
jgi:hypothetical protein